MAGYEAIWTGLEAMEKAFVRAGVQADLAARENVSIAAMTLIRDAKNNFDGAGQPVNRTNHLRQSIMTDGLKHHAMGIYSTSAGPSSDGGLMKYGRRVELGFRGTDSIGRHYNQGPRPYFGPAAAVLRAEMGAIATANWARFIKY